MRLTLDFESRSACDLTTAGPWRYASHPTTQVICLGVKADDEPARLWWAPWVQPEGAVDFPSDNLTALVEKAEQIQAHNSEFERAIWEKIMVPKYGFPEIPLAKWSCTAARAAVHGLPRKLADACRVLGMPIAKDLEGHALMKKMCKPRKPRKGEDAKGLYWREEPEDFRRLGEYCLVDVEAEAALDKVLRPLSQTERRVWELDQEINRRGIAVDLPAVRSVIETLYTHEDELLKETATLTSGLVDSPRKVAALREWLEGRGVKTENLQKATVTEALANGVGPDVRRVLEIRQALGRASTGKFTAIAQRADKDQRCRSLFMYHGASTGRWSGKAVQAHNLPRDSYAGEELEVAFNLFGAHDRDGLALLLDEPFAAASRCVRGSLVAGPGKELVCADFSSIEARGNAWLAGQEDVVQAFRDGLDLYKVEAAGTFGCRYEDVDKKQRQVGKVEILSLGYGGGISAFAAMAGNYGLDLETLPPLILHRATQEEREQGERTARGFLERQPGAMSPDAALACDVIKQKWRAKNTKIVRLWQALGEAAGEAVANPGRAYTFRSVAFRTWRDPRKNEYLVCRLPSGRLLYYASPSIRPMRTPWGKLKDVLTYWGVDSVTRQWTRQKAPGFLLCENIVQALCRDLLAEAMLRVEAAGYPVVLHVHDEAVSEVPVGFGSLEEYEQLMAVVPSWAAGLPVSAVGWRGRRYRKE